MVSNIHGMTMTSDDMNRWERRQSFDAGAVGVPTTPVKKCHATKEGTDVTTLFVQHVLNFLTLGKSGAVFTGVPTCANSMERQESRNMAPFTDIYRVG